MAIVRHVTDRLRGTGDDGVTLIEILVALSLLMVLSATVAGGLLVVQKSALTSKERSAAANLATREIEITRNWFHSADTAPAAVMAAGDVTNGNPLPGQTGALVVDNVPYTVKRQVTWLVTGTGVSACDGGSVVTYPSIGVHVQVTWPNMGPVPPVVSDTVLTPPKSVLNATSAYIAVKVLDRDGAPNAGRDVTATGPGGSYNDTTGPDGCATFVLSTAGTYTLALTDGSSGYVSFNGATTQTATVTAGSLTVRSFSYDLGESFAATLTPPTGFSLPNTLPAVTVGNSGILPSGVASYPSAAGGTTTIGPLWPFASGYSVWAGSCTDSDPALDGGRPPALVPAKGSTTATTAALQGLAITTTRIGVPTVAQVTATYAGSGSCPAADNVIDLGTSAGGVLNSSLPYGNWTLSTIIGGQTVNSAVTVTSSAAVAVTLDGTV
jgi:type II secretory pathway pseudopilin PulG